jgi:biotin-(acetyl-CoA carboxylase) ligase
MRAEAIAENALSVELIRQHQSTYLDEWLITYRDQGPPALLRAWRDLEIVSGRRVEAWEDGAVFEGRALGVGADGHLEVENARGRVHRVVAGDVRLLE